MAGDDRQVRELKAAAELASIRAEAARRTGWEPWMTEEVGFGDSEPGNGSCVKKSEGRHA
jgi:hypothetical protein